jgi:hypothetical protein
LAQRPGYYLFGVFCSDYGYVWIGFTVGRSGIELNPRPKGTGSGTICGFARFWRSHIASARAHYVGLQVLFRLVDL